MEKKTRTPLNEIVLEEGITAEEYLKRFDALPEDKQIMTEAIYRGIEMGYWPLNRLLIGMIAREEYDLIRRPRRPSKRNSTR